MKVSTRPRRLGEQAFPGRRIGFDLGRLEKAVDLSGKPQDAVGSQEPGTFDVQRESDERNGMHFPASNPHVGVEPGKGFREQLGGRAEQVEMFPTDIRPEDGRHDR